MNTQSLCRQLLNTDQLHIQNIQIDDARISLFVESTHRDAICPVCAQNSTEIHSTYTRHPMDLAWANHQVIIHLEVKRFFCRNRACSKRTFAEQFPNFLARYARCTQRVVEKQRSIGVNVCSRVAEPLLRSLRIGISNTTVDRVMRALPAPETPRVQVLGVDDWAKRKGQRYGTILVDLETSRVIELLEDRTADTLVKWLREHAGIEIVSRDRSATYAEAVERGAPKAVQVADRWHLLHNVSDAVFKVMQQEYGMIQKALGPQTEPVEINQLAEKSKQHTALTPSEQRRKERIEHARENYAQGWTQKEIARALGVKPKTISRYLQGRSTKVNRQRSRRNLDPFKPYLLQRWNEGCHNAAQLFREIKSKDYPGEATMVRLFVRQLREASGTLPVNQGQLCGLQEIDPLVRPPTLRTLTWWVLRRPEDRKEAEEKLLDGVSRDQPKLWLTISLAREFAKIIREQQSEQLDGWLEAANQSGYRVWQNFGAGLKQDKAAVLGALHYHWSNGPTEGHINRLKCLKRLMYGRAKDDLLRKRVLWQGSRLFT